MTTYLTPTPLGGEIVQRSNSSLAVPGGYPLVPGYGVPQPVPAEAPAGKPSVFRRFDKVAPLAMTTIPVLAGRIWHYAGAAHRVGDALLLGGVSAASMIGAGIGAGSAVVAATALGIAGGLAAAAIAGYATSILAPLAVWSVGTAAAYAVSWRTWRADARLAEDREERRETAERHESAETHREWIRAQRDLGVAATYAQAQVMTAQINADAYREVASRLTVPPIPDADASIFEVSPAGQRMLGEQVVMPASSQFAFDHAEQRAA